MSGHPALRLGTLGLGTLSLGTLARPATIRQSLDGYPELMSDLISNVKIAQVNIVHGG